MSEQRFERWNDHSCKVKDNQEDTLLNWEDVIHKLNKQQSIIQELERKLKKYEKIGEEQLKQIIELQEENEQLRKELNDCEKFRYTVFKRIGELVEQVQHILKNTSTYLRNLWITATKDHEPVEQIILKVY